MFKPHATRNNERVEEKFHTEFHPRNWMDRSGKIRVSANLLPPPLRKITRDTNVYEANWTSGTIWSWWHRKYLCPRQVSETSVPAHSWAILLVIMKSAEAFTSYEIYKISHTESKFISLLYPCIIIHSVMLCYSNDWHVIFAILIGFSLY